MISRQSWYTKLGLVYNAVLKSLQQKCRMHYVYFREKTNLVVNRESNDSFRHEHGTKKKSPP